MRAEQAMSAAASTMAADLRDTLFRILRDQAGTTAFRDLDEDAQQRIKGDLHFEVIGAVRKAVTTIAAVGFENVSAQVDAVTIKKDVKLGFILTERTAEAMDILARSYGKEVQIVFADPSLFLQTQGELALGASDTEGPELVAHEDDDAEALEDDETTEHYPGAIVDPTTAAIVQAVEADVETNGSTDPEPETPAEETDPHIPRGVGSGRPVRGRTKPGRSVFGAH